MTPASDLQATWSPQSPLPAFCCYSTSCMCHVERVPTPYRKPDSTEESNTLTLASQIGNLRSAQGNNTQFLMCLTTWTSLLTRRVSTPVAPWPRQGCPQTSQSVEHSGQRLLLLKWVTLFCSHWTVKMGSSGGMFKWVLLALIQNMMLCLVMSG